MTNLTSQLSFEMRKLTVLYYSLWPKNGPTSSEKKSSIDTKH